MKIDPLTFSSNSIRLEPVSFQGLHDFHEYSLMPELYQYLEYDPFLSIDDSKNYLQKLISRSNSPLCQYWFIKLGSPGKVVGTFGLHSLNIQRKSVEIGFGVSPLYSGKGIFTAAAKILIEFCFFSLDLRRISALTHAKNPGSIAALSKIGFVKEGQLRDYYRDTAGKWSDAVIFSLINS